MRQGLHRIIVVAAALWASTPSRGDACPNAVLATDKTVAAVKEAEKILDDGDPAEALRRIRALLGQVRPRNRRAPAKHICEFISDADEFEAKTPSANGLTDRAHRIISLSNIRIDDCQGEKRAELLAQASSMLEEFAKARPNDAAKQADLGEALAKTRPREARKILEGLAKRDVVSTPYAYAALARLRAADGDEKGRDEALARCKPMAKVESICRLQ
jgi:predicted Zn-dependent protease